MDTSNTQAQTSDLVLIGGGHSHLSVIKNLGMNPIPNLRITLISQDIHTPYSGMLPGLIAGHYDYDEAHIDLRKLCQWAGIRLIQGTVNNINTEEQKVMCAKRAPMRYDWLSINVGAQPATHTIKGAPQIGIAVKPIQPFLQCWQQRLKDFNAQPQPRSIAIVGGGAASVEVALACQFQLQQQLEQQADLIQITIISGSSQILPSHNQRVQRYMTKLLAERGIGLILGKKVAAIEQQHQQRLTLDDNSTLFYDETIWAIHASSQTWLKQTQLACDNNGFIEVNPYLQSYSHNNIFAAGDTVHFVEQPHAKSGVYAVRAGEYLANNLRAAIESRALTPYRPQRHFLSLLMTGDKQAIASKGTFSLAGKWVWRWKNHIDQKFMAKFRIDPRQNSSSSSDSNHLQNRCGGCGAKISQRTLQRVLSQLSIVDNTDVVVGINKPDDAAVITPPANKQWLQTVDYFRTFIDDPYLLGRIATHHCTSDIYAMGGTPHSALAIATIPYASETLIEDTLLQLMSGAVDSLNEQQTSLIGGHSNEGAELGFGLAVNGTLNPEQLLNKNQLSEGQLLILTKPLGTGTLLAANMHSQAQGRWVENAIQHMLISNQQAAIIVQQHQASACTDITGFGLAGHLLEMLKPDRFNARLQLQQLPILNGATHTAKNGWVSSLQAENLRVATQINNANHCSQHPNYPLLFDPQTSGGLLAAIPAVHATACLNALRDSNCHQAAIVGKIERRMSDHQQLPLISLA